MYYYVYTVYCIMCSGISDSYTVGEAEEELNVAMTGSEPGIVSVK